MKINAYVLASLVTAVLSIALLWAVQNSAYRWAVEQAAYKGEQQLLSSVVRLRDLVGRYRDIPFVITQNAFVQQALEAPSNDSREAASRYLEQINLISGATALMTLDQSGQVVSYSRWRSEEEFLSSSHASKAYFQTAQRGQQGLSVEVDGEGFSSLYLSAPIYNHAQFVGAAVVRIDLLVFQQQLSRDVRYSLETSLGSNVLSSEPEWQSGGLSDVEKHIDLDGRIIQVANLGQGERVIVQSVLLDDLDWRMTNFQSLNDAEQARKNTLFVSIVVLASGWLLVLYRRERIAKKRSLVQVQTLVAASEEQQKDIIDNVNVGLIAVDERCRIAFINPMALSILRMSSEQVQHMNMLAHVKTQKDPFDNQLASVLASLDSANFEPLLGYDAYLVRQDETQVPVLVSVQAMTAKEKPLFLITVVDISRRKGLEEALTVAKSQLEAKVRERTKVLEQTRDELVHAEKMAALGRMSSAIVHELNQPLTAINTYVAICQHLAAQDIEKLPGQLEMIKGLTERMSGMTRQLKAFAFKKPESVGAVNLGGVLDSVLASQAARIKSDDVRLEVNVTRKVWVDGDVARFEQVISNLIVNALDALLGASVRELGVNLQVENNQATMRVRDTGVGISSDNLDQIFDPFVTTKSIGSGLGLGLSIVKSIVQDLNGVINVSSSLGKGTEFVLSFPISSCDIRSVK